MWLEYIETEQGKEIVTYRDRILLGTQAILGTLGQTWIQIARL